MVRNRMISKHKVNLYLQSFINNIEKNGLLSDTLFVFTYGSTTLNVDFIPNINIGIIVKKTDKNVLKKWRKSIKYIRKRGRAMPLFMSEDEFLKAVNTFPIEYQDMKWRHFKLYGRDLFTDITIKSKNTKLQIEEELRAKYVRIREIYFTSPTKGILKKVIFKMISSLNILLKFLIYIELFNNPDKYRSVIGNEKIDEVVKKFSGVDIYDFLKFNFGLKLDKMKDFYNYKYKNIKVDIDDDSFLIIIDEWQYLINYINGYQAD